MYITYVTVCAVFVWRCQGADVFSSLERLRALMDFERDTLQLADIYIAKETERFEQTKRLAGSLLDSYKETGEDELDGIVTNPMGALNVIDRFATIWKTALSLTSNFSSFLGFKETVEYKFKDFVPSDEDLKGAYLSFVRLQEIYKLDTEQLLEGKIRNQQSDYRLDGHDCFNLALASNQRWQHQNAIKWLDRGMDLMEHGPEWELMARLLADQIQKFKGPGVPPQSPYRSDWWYNYEALCRGETIQPQPKPLYCTYRGHAVPYSPWKEEVLNLEPYMSLIYDFITDGENARIREEAFPTLSRAKVGGQEDSRVSDVRVGRVAWLYTHMSRLSRMLTMRTEDATGLECLLYAESFQIGNYGMGGHYEPHQDSDPIRFANANIEGRIMGDRMATLMIYLSEVTAGGATVFPKLGLAVKPVRNAAIFWYNLKKNGQAFEEALHGACPVLLGNKWVANKWIHENGQMRTRPCDLNPDR